MGEILCSDECEIVDIAKLQEVMDKFALATGVAAIVANPEGRAITRPSNFSTLCQAIRASEVGRARCEASDAKLGREALSGGQPAMHQCHFGLIDLAAPLVVGDIWWGSVLCGQFLLAPPSRNQLQRVANYARELGLDSQKAVEWFKQIQIVSEERIRASFDLLHIVSQLIVEMGLARLAQQRVIEEMAARAEIERNLRAAELKALQTQVNPHFLFNTLNAASRLAMMEGAPRTQELVFALASLLRYSLRKIDQLVPLSEEILHIRLYLFIHQIRYPDRIRVEIDVPQELMTVRVPLLTLQPLVENAIVHGLEPKIEGGTVRISGRKCNGQALIVVEDTGVGMPPDRLAEVVSSRSGRGHTTGLGLNNVRSRLRHYFGPESDITVESRPGAGTRVTIRVPLDHRANRE